MTEETKKKLRVCAYCRVSTDEDTQATSYELQVQNYTKMIHENPEWEFAGIFADEGISGTSVLHREHFLEMIEKCKAGEIDLIITKQVSRFARNVLDSLNYIYMLRRLDPPVGVYFEAEKLNTLDKSSDMIITVLSLVAQSESEQKSNSLKWSFKRRRAQGLGVYPNWALLGYKGRAWEIDEDEADVVRTIYSLYLEGYSSPQIADFLTKSGIPTVKGLSSWSSGSVLGILRNEKYCGDALLQKTFIKDCISKKAILNTGQLPKVLIQDNHEAIVSREMFDAVQLEIARRRAQDGRTRKSAPTGRGKFSGKYALSGLLFCAECGTAYRRVVWTQHGEKRAVWRCTSRLDYGKRYCLHSPTLDEGPLQQAVLNAINSAMSDHGTLTAQLIDALEQELAPIPGESMSLGDIDRAMESLGQQFNDLLREAADANNADSYTAQFQSISTAMAEFKRRKAMILQIRQEQEQTNRRVQAVASVLKTASSELTEWDDNVIYQLLEKVTVLSRERIRVTLRDGLEIEQAVEQPKRRKFA